MQEFVLGENAAKVYGFLSRAYFRPPDRSYLEAIAAWSSELLAQRDALPQGIAEALELMSTALAEIETGKVLELQQEFVRLFRGLSPQHSPPPPYESVYRGSPASPATWGSSTVEVRRKYREFGLEPAEDFRGEPPDQLGLELQFMAHLCEEAPLQWEVQRAFLEEHLSWFGAFRGAVLKHAPHRFYEGILNLTEQWLKLHQEYLATVEAPE